MPLDLDPLFKALERDKAAETARLDKVIGLAQQATQIAGAWQIRALAFETAIERLTQSIETGNTLFAHHALGFLKDAKAMIDKEYPSPAKDAEKAQEQK